MMMTKLDRVLSLFFRFLLFLCFFYAITGISSLNAQIPDDYEMMRNYSLPKNAIEYSALSLADSLMMHKGKAFSGLAFELYPSKNPYRVISYRNGYQHGPLLIWYADGAPQLYTNYRKGSPHGRFIGWYASGAVIYNIVLNKGTLGGDFQYEDDDSRVSTETEIIEVEGTDND